MQQDKDHDNGINIKFKSDRDKKGEYKLIAKNGGKNYHRNQKVANGKNQGEMVPPDGGWGWFVLLAAVMVNLLIPGTVKSFGVLFVVYLEVFSTTPSEASWIPALCYFLYSSLGPLSSILSVKYSYRTVTLIGGTLAAVGMMLSFFANSVSFLYVSYGLLVGAGAGLAFPPTVYIVTSYFVRKRGLANGLCISGSAIGSIILPPLLRFLLHEYGYRGSVLIMGAIMLNVWASGLLYEPVENHLIPAKVTTCEENNDDDDDDNDDEVVEEEGEEEVEENEDVGENHIGTTTITVTSPDDDDKVKNHHLIVANNSNNSKTKGNNAATPFVPKSASSVALENYKNSPVQGRMRKISMPTPSAREITGQMHSTPALHVVPERTIRRRTGQPPKSPSSSSFHYVSTPYHGSTLSALHPEHASTLTLNAISSTFRKSPEKKAGKPIKEPETKFFDFSLLRDPLYLVILISNSTNALSYTNFVILLPNYANDLKYTKNEGMLLLPIVSVFDLIGRIGGSALSDKNLMPKHWYFVGGLLISGISLTILPSATNYIILSIYSGIFGLASGIYVGITAVIMADMLGTEKLTSSYGISLFVNGVVQLVGPPIVNSIYERIGTLGPIFSVLGIVLIVGASLWGFVPFIRRKPNRADQEFEKC
ncbi:monocarboxylate transporter 9 [Leptopilina boulardi]|uniref:monocarboxylate transporter 9 n=1 Tax=Leptopilina boulardi TaxID=63433 RepID=UPI0021F50AA9|nr:monocarboxylate transporter 9 [Leptopilina boulardi]XP_051160592.1 monocarboxylate transporter 9 [Leptopilina boulardi]